MAFTLSRNLKLRLDSNLTANATYNLSRIDLLGGTFLVDSTDLLNVRSRGNITIEPESADIGGSASGGTVSIGTTDHEISSLAINAAAIQLSSPLSLLDQATGGTKYLLVQYKSDVAGSVDTTSNRTLSFDLSGADRSVVLGGALTTAGGDLTFTLAGASSLSLPTSGTLATLAGVETLTNKSISATNNTLTNIANASISASAAIVYSKLALTSSIVNADISPSAAISYSKLSLTNSVINADIASGAAIAYSKLNLTSSLVNADVSSSAAIAGTKISPDFGSQIVSTSNRYRLASTYNTDLLPATSGQVTSLQFYLPPNYGTSGYVLRTDGAGNLSWTSPTGGGSTVTGYSTTWLAADGTTKVVTHSLNSSDVEISIYDTTDGEFILIGTSIVTDSNTVTLTSSEAPSVSWHITVQANA